MVPYDVLVDPLSLPSHPVISDKRNTHQVIHADSMQGSDEEEVRFGGLWEGVEGGTLLFWT